MTAHAFTRTAVCMPAGSSPSSISVADLGRPARIEEHVALADRRLLGEQPGLEQRLPHLLARARARCRRTRAPGGRSRCGSRPTCPCRRAAGGSGGRRGGPGSGSSCGRTARPRRARAGRGRRPRAPRPTRGSSGRPPSRATASATRSGWCGADRLRAARRPSSSRPGRATARARRRSMPRGVLLEGERRELLEVGRVGAAGQPEERGSPPSVAGPQPQVVGPAARAGSAELDERGDDGGDEQPGALGRPPRGRRATRRRPAWPRAARRRRRRRATSTGAP